jgi:hypothetical protein
MRVGVARFVDHPIYTVDSVRLVNTGHTTVTATLVVSHRFE